MKDYYGLEGMTAISGGGGGAVETIESMFKY
jgi:hypothetical protein